MDFKTQYLPFLSVLSAIELLPPTSENIEVIKINRLYNLLCFIPCEVYPPQFNEDWQYPNNHTSFIKEEKTIS